MKNRYRESFPANLMYANLWSASTVVEALITGTGLTMCLLLWDRGSVSLGVVYLIHTYCNLVIQPLMDFRNHMGNMQGARAGIIRTQEFLNLPLRGQGADKLTGAGVSFLAQGPVRNCARNCGRECVSDSAIELVIENLNFAYADKKPVLENINLAVPAGGRVGIMGETGCGKSTLLALIAGLNNFEHGGIRLDGFDLRGIDNTDLRRRVAYCTQRVQLVHGSIRDNITFWDDSHSDEDILCAIERLDLAEWFAKFPAGLETNFEMGEGSLSSGEAQLLVLVRLSLRRPGLVLLDEISSSLDATAEKRVTAAVKKLCEGRTVISVAHRREALDWMDSVLIMENGAFAQCKGDGHAR